MSGREPTIRRALTKDQGEVGVADAIAWFVRAGWTVSVPLVDNQAYDLVVDDGDHLHRVQVKTSTCRTPSGGCAVELRTNGGNRSRSTSSPFDPGACDLLYVLTDDGRWVVVPTQVVRARTSIVMGPKWAAYAVQWDG